MHRPLRLTIDSVALVHNWRALADHPGVPAGAAIKADAYGLGARTRSDPLRCRLPGLLRGDLVGSRGAWSDTGDASLSVLHGVGSDDAGRASLSARPVLNTVEQVTRWKEAAPGRACDVMIDTGMNRLGLRPDEISALDGLTIETLHSHLACADEDHDLNGRQLQRFRDVASAGSGERYSLANSAGIFLGRDYSFDLVRPGLALYGGIPRPEGAGTIQQVAHVEAQVVQRRTIRAGESCGYGATFVAEADTRPHPEHRLCRWLPARLLIKGTAFVGEFALPVLGRVSMDLIAVGCDAARPQGRRLGRDRLRPADGVRGVGAFPVRAADGPWARGSRGAGLSPRRRRLRLVPAEVDHRAPPALRLARLADVAAMQDQPVVRVQPEGLRNDLLQLELDLKHVLARGETGAIADAEDVRVDGEGFSVESSVENDVGRLPPDAG